MEMLNINREEFHQWLAEKPAGEQVGLGNHCRECPIALFLLYKTGRK